VRVSELPRENEELKAEANILSSSSGARVSLARYLKSPAESSPAGEKGRRGERRFERESLLTLVQVRLHFSESGD
jgi:hypothetical protein